MYHSFMCSTMQAWLIELSKGRDGTEQSNEDRETRCIAEVESHCLCAIDARIVRELRADARLLVARGMCMTRERKIC